MSEGRPFRCRDCGELDLALTTTGPLPSVCDSCDPEAAVRRGAARDAARAARDAARAVSRNRAQVVTGLRARVAELEHVLGASSRVPGGVDRLVLAQAIRAVGQARGHAATRAALLHLRDVAQAWADQIGAVHDPDLTQTLARSEVAA